MKTRIALSILLGIGAFIALSVADEIFTSPGHRETPPVSWLMTFLYLALAQFVLAPKGKGFAATGPTLVAMVVPVAGIFLLSLAVEKHANVSGQILWWLLLCCGAAIGAAAASIYSKRVVRGEGD